MTARTGPTPPHAALLLSPGTHPTRLASLLASLLALTLAPACTPGEPTPTATAEAYVAAIQRGDTRALLPLLDGRARARLAAAAERASDQVGGRRTIAPHEMLQVVDLDPTLQVARVELLEGDDTVARVRVHGSQEQTIDLDLVHEEGAWRVRAPLPPNQPP